MKDGEIFVVCANPYLSQHTIVFYVSIEPGGGGRALYSNNISFVDFNSYMELWSRIWIIL